MKYGHLSKEEKLDSSITTLTILSSRLPEPFSGNVLVVIDYLKDIKEEITKSEGE